uniref:peroxidase n=1 Tax=Rhizophora mucronata TaxID=61149 RepID=A0A2P2JJL3_RHIMU
MTSFVIFFVVVVITFVLHAITVSAATPLLPGFYSETCPKAESIVRNVMRNAMIREPRAGASVMRFQFHDCFVNVSQTKRHNFFK